MSLLLLLLRRLGLGLLLCIVGRDGGHGGGVARGGVLAVDDGRVCAVGRSRIGIVLRVRVGGWCENDGGGEGAGALCGMVSSVRDTTSGERT